MAATTAERQRAFRRRQTDRIATLEQENVRLRADLADALAEAERLAASSAGIRPPQSTAATATPATPTSGDP